MKRRDINIKVENMFIYDQLSITYSFRYGLVVRMLDSHSRCPGSIPGIGNFF
jgi:hypothetical protein